MAKAALTAESYLGLYEVRRGEGEVNMFLCIALSMLLKPLFCRPTIEQPVLETAM